MPIPFVVFGAWAAAVSIYDIRVRRVPNGLVLLGLACAGSQFVPGCAGLTRVGELTLAQSLLGGALAFAVFVPLYAFRAMGAADVKVFAVLGVWLGGGVLLPVWMIASVAACVHAVYAVARTRLPPVVVFGHAVALGGAAQRPIRGAPYAAFLVLAVCAVLAHRAGLIALPVWGG
ncbi:A24 family peptidase [Pararobbsia silviterrae]|uniref:Prepilin peptidase n=1 Tax=Pararobbsia silviterrae TaxID=1792498 RepID=A0A494XI83_9BURK|nr:prepilin peptidase [Pararobbsia silviterrae]RKP50258.1 prepilin peptidase [Pararobbsia silviterrae]